MVQSWRHWCIWPGRQRELWAWLPTWADAGLRPSHPSALAAHRPSSRTCLTCAHSIVLAVQWPANSDANKYWLRHNRLWVTNTSYKSSAERRSRGLACHKPALCCYWRSEQAHRQRSQKIESFWNLTVSLKSHLSSPITAFRTILGVSIKL